MKEFSTYITHAVIDPRAVRHNISALKRLAANHRCRLADRQHILDGRLRSGDLLAVIKADAYGHGMLEMARLIVREKGVQIAVSDVQEGISLRSAGIKSPILLLETSLLEQAALIVKSNLTPTVCNWELAKALNDAAARLKKPFPIHVKIDTGMRRQGIRLEEAFGFVSELFCLKHLRIQGIYTHFPSADSDRQLTQRQVALFRTLIESLDAAGLFIPFVHAANSAGLAGYHSDIFNLFRPGLMLYGLYPSAALRKAVSLRPAMSVMSKIILIKGLKAGEAVSYGQTFKARCDLCTAIVPIGYNDGYFRSFSDKAHVLVGGKKCPVLGRVTMDQIIVDVSGVKNPRLGMDVIILGRQGRNEIFADDLAKWAETISYEIVCALGNRLPRVVRGV